MLVSDILASSAALLNDALMTRMTYARTLPYFRIMYRELQLALVENELQPVTEVSAKITLLTPMKALTSASTPPLPTDFLAPLSIQEKLPSEAVYNPMTQVDQEPIDDPQLYLGVWAYRENEIKFRGATGNVDLIITYQKNLDTVSTEASTFVYPKAASFAEYRTAELCARYINEDNTRADNLKIPADKALESYLSAEIHRGQSLSIRHKPFRRVR
jgi:hypothetical protein